MSSEKVVELVSAIADIGREHPLPPPAKDALPFARFFNGDALDRDRLDEMDGECTRRELLARFLILCAVLDQGPDIPGVRQLMLRVVDQMYSCNVRMFHAPMEFFQAMNVSLKEIWDAHEDIKKKNADDWAIKNNTTPGRYNLFMEGGKQSLNYAVSRWGTALALPYVLAQDAEASGRPTSLVDYLEKFESAEAMSVQIKDDNRYGLGKAIGNKACHLFAKWMVSTFALVRRNDEGWGEYSFEVPYDSNAGRVLWRTGYLLHLAEESEYRKNNVIQPGEGKGGLNYIRVTNMRGMKISRSMPNDVFDVYRHACVNCLKTHKISPKTMEVQRVQHAFLIMNSKSVAEFDDGLIYVGREFCHNHDKPDCARCPLRNMCEGVSSRPELIKKYRT